MKTGAAKRPSLWFQSRNCFRKWAAPRRPFPPSANALEVAVRPDQRLRLCQCLAAAAGRQHHPHGKLASVRDQDLAAEQRPIRHQVEAAEQRLAPRWVVGAPHLALPKLYS